MKRSEEYMSRGRGRGRSSKKLKDMDYESDDEYNPSSFMKNVVVHSNSRARVTRSKAIEIGASSVIPINNDAVICPCRTPDACYPARVKQPAETNMPLAGEDDKLQLRPLTVPSSTQLVENVMPCAIEETGVRKAHSSSHDEQAQSSVAPISINVEGYYVKKEVAHMLQQIFHKRNDVARDCIIMNREIVVPILEVICSYCQKLQNTCLKDIMDSEVEDLALVVKNFQQMGFDVKWLIERLKDISEMKRLMKDYPTLKEEKIKVEMKEKEVDMLKQKWSVAEAELATMKFDVDDKWHEFDRQIKALKVKGVPYWDKPLFHGVI